MVTVAEAPSLPVVATGFTSSVSRSRRAPATMRSIRSRRAITVSPPPVTVCADTTGNTSRRAATANMTIERELLHTMAILPSRCGAILKKVSEKSVSDTWCTEAAERCLTPFSVTRFFTGRHGSAARLGFHHGLLVDELGGARSVPRVVQSRHAVSRHGPTEAGLGAGARAGD